MRELKELYPYESRQLSQVFITVVLAAAKIGQAQEASVQPKAFEIVEHWARHCS